MEGMNCVVKALVIFAIVIFGIAEAEAMATLGGKRAVENQENSLEIEELGRFAVDQHNAQQNEIGKGVLSFGRVVKAETQVVAGTMYYLTIEAKQAEGDAEHPPKLYEAK
ncbi:hypothetical protein KI387_004824, partial [Taxus chinensis]